MTPLSAFYTRIEPLCPGVSEPQMDQALLDVCIDFCERTNIVQLIEVQTVGVGGAEIDAPSAYAQVWARVLAVSVGDRMIHAVGVDDVRSGAAMRADEDREVPIPTGTPQCYYAPTPGAQSLFLYPASDAEIAVAVRASMRPAVDATEVDDSLFLQWHRAIVSGTLAHLLAMPNTPFSNPMAAASYGRQYRAELSGASNDARRGAVRSGVRVSPQPFA